MSNRHQTGSGNSSIHVLAGVMRDVEGRVLVAQRPEGKSMAGAWEFPGGKIETGETRFEGLVREFREELGVEVDAARPLLRYQHRYSEVTVDLDVWAIERWTGRPHGRESQAIGWHHAYELNALDLLPADDPIVRSLQLPSLCAVTPGAHADRTSFLDTIESLVARNTAILLVLRLPGLTADELLDIAAGTACRLEGTQAKLLLHGDPRTLGPIINRLPDDIAPRLRGVLAGLHIPGRCLEGLARRPVQPGLWFGASCHNKIQLGLALAAGADYAFLGPVKRTASHPGAPGMGWERFTELVRELPMPVYAIGGLAPEDLETAWAAGAQGIAAIQGLWPS